MVHSAYARHLSDQRACALALVRAAAKRQPATARLSVALGEVVAVAESLARELPGADCAVELGEDANVTPIASHCGVFAETDAQLLLGSAEWHGVYWSTFGATAPSAVSASGHVDCIKALLQLGMGMHVHDDSDEAGVTGEDCAKRCPSRCAECVFDCCTEHHAEFRAECCTERRTEFHTERRTEFRTECRTKFCAECRIKCHAELCAEHRAERRVERRAAERRIKHHTKFRVAELDAEIACLQQMRGKAELLSTKVAEIIVWCLNNDITVEQLIEALLG
eukprot:m51a1_g12693 hypothetical protein (280) ;mRNA; r:286-5154